MDGEELTYDKHSPLGGGRSSNVYKGDLHGKVVAVKVLSEEVQGDVGAFVDSIPICTKSVCRACLNASSLGRLLTMKMLQR